MQDRRDYLLEIGVEELPARFIDPALDELRQTATSILKEKRLSFSRVLTYGAPRRLALLVEGLAGSQESLETQVKGPAVKVAFKNDVPTRAAEGFARSQGVAVTDLIQKPVGHVEYVFAVKREAGRPAREVLSEMAPALINGLHFPKPMRWGDTEARFARPVRWMVSLFGKDIVEFEFAGLKAGRTTFGHRFLSKKPIVLKTSSEYKAAMRNNYVIVDSTERKEKIRRQVQELAAGAGLYVEEDEELLGEVNNLVEYPTALMGEFNKNYLGLPKEVLVTPMREHQRYFPVVDADGKLAAKFIAVKNGAADHLDIIRAGNEKVLKARLADAEFFFREDLKTSLAEKIPELKKVVFQENLGSVFDKMQRVKALTGYLSGVMGASSRETKVALRASDLAKADLVTNMVYEFPELQGTMGREYAERSGEGRAVATAIFEHYLPRFAGDRLPGSLPGKVISIADKIDTIVGCFAIGIQPSGSQDPYALRRQALGISNILLDGQIALSLNELIEAACRGFEGKVGFKLSLEKVKEEVTGFFKQRLKGIFSDRGFSYDTVDAVLASGYDNFSETMLRAVALTRFRQAPAFNDLLTAFMRANNLSKDTSNRLVKPERLVDSSEKELYQRFVEVQKETKASLKKQDYSGLLASVSTLQPSLDVFFNSVMVMVDDQKLRENRLALLANIADLAREVADISKLVV